MDADWTLTVLCLITSEVSAVAEHDLHIVTLVDGGEEPQQEQDGPQSSGQLQSVQIYRKKTTQGQRQWRYAVRVDL